MVAMAVDAEQLAEALQEAAEMTELSEVAVELEEVAVELAKAVDAVEFGGRSTGGGGNFGRVSRGGG